MAQHERGRRRAAEMANTSTEQLHVRRQRHAHRVAGMLAQPGGDDLGIRGVDVARLWTREAREVPRHDLLADASPQGALFGSRREHQHERAHADHGGRDEQGPAPPPITRESRGR